ncbi:MAG: AAA family ATPase [Gluconacetobacter diazotrophicus]|nr:AAA family ATPase [Gluconacetobacter diazotrophicus]
MFRLERIVLSNWGRLDPQDIEIRGQAAILGPTGAGKSTVVDALQVVITGASSRFYDLNKSTGGQNSRSIRDYCLGADDHISPDAPARDASDTLLALAFRDPGREGAAERAVTIGLLFSAVSGEPMAQPRARFVMPDTALTLSDLLEARENGRPVVPTNNRVLDRLKGLCPTLRLHNSAIAYVADYLREMRSGSASPDPQQVLRNFRQSVAFQPINDPTEFVRRHILEESDVDVEALQGSIGRYRFLESEVGKRERQLAAIAEARRRFGVWAQHSIRHAVLRFTAASAQCRRQELLADDLRRRRAELAAATEKELGIRRRIEGEIAGAQEDLLRQKALLLEVPEAMQARALESERSLFEEKARSARAALSRRAAQLLRLDALTRQSRRVPVPLQPALAAVGEFAALVRNRTPDAWGGTEEELAALEARIVPLCKAEDSLDRQLDAIGTELREQKAELDAIEARLAGGGDGPMLSPPVREFLRLLDRAGIRAVPLPDVVDAVDPDWAMALEMLLGPNREAVIVPRERTADAFDILHRERRQLSSCRLVDTRRTERADPRRDPRSIASVVRTEDRDALVFIEKQVGRFHMADSDAELERMEQGVTRRGKTTQGMALRVYRDVEPILGRTAQHAAAERARSSFSVLSARMGETVAARDGLRAALEALAAIRDEPRDALADALNRLSEARTALRGVDTARSRLQTPDGARVRETIAEIELEIRQRRQALVEEVEPRLKTLGDADVTLQVELAGSDAIWNRAVAEQERHRAEIAEPPLSALIEMLAPAETIAAAEARIAAAAEFGPLNRDPAGSLAELAVRARAEAEPLPRLAAEAAKRGRGGFFEFVADTGGGSPLRDPDDLSIFRWCRDQEQRLENDELRRYRDEFVRAREAMELDLTEGLINRLSDKFLGARAQIDRLNRALAGRRFTNQSYSVRHSLNAAMRPIHALAEAVAEAPQRGLSLLHDPDVDPRIVAGFKELERRLGDEQLVRDLRDYRRFFDFELYMVNERGQETTLSKRSATGSGGQKQAPYYVAVGAAMAAAYYPKSAPGEPDGIGLVVFDEAFNNLDAPNTRALLAFFADLHLQVIVAAPDKVRAMFLETVDTIVSVNRRPDTQEPVVSVTYPSARAREALSGLNPVNRGVEAFREASAAATGD